MKIVLSKVEYSDDRIAALSGQIRNRPRVVRDRDGRCSDRRSKPLHVGGKPIDLPGLHNVMRISDQLINGSSPEGDAGFTSLRSLGIKTILSVDGARPDLVRAKKVGIRYAHLPISYGI